MDLGLRSTGFRVASSGFQEAVNELRMRVGILASREEHMGTCLLLVAYRLELGCVASLTITL